MVAQLTLATYALWLVTILLESCLFAVCLIRPHKHPLFTAYIGFCILKSLVLFWASFGHPWSYWYGYWAGAIIEGTFVLSIMAELCYEVFSPFWTIPRLTLKKFIPFVTALVVFAIAASVETPNSPLRILTIGRAVERSVSLLLFAGAASAVGLSTYLGIPWKSHAYGIAVGFVVNLSVSSVVQVVSSPFILGPALDLRYVSMISFVLAEIIWLRYLSSPEPALTPIAKPEIREAQHLVSAFAAGTSPHDGERMAKGYQKCQVGRLR